MCPVLCGMHRQISTFLQNPRYKGKHKIHTDKLEETEQNLVQKIKQNLGKINVALLHSCKYNFIRNNIKCILNHGFSSLATFNWLLQCIRRQEGYKPYVQYPQVK